MAGKAVISSCSRGPKRSARVKPCCPLPNSIRPQRCFRRGRPWGGGGLLSLGVFGGVTRRDGISCGWTHFEGIIFIVADGEVFLLGAAKIFRSLWVVPRFGRLGDVVLRVLSAKDYGEFPERKNSPRRTMAMGQSRSGNIFP